MLLSWTHLLGWCDFLIWTCFFNLVYNLTHGLFSSSKLHMHLILTYVDRLIYCIHFGKSASWGRGFSQFLQMGWSSWHCLCRQKLLQLTQVYVSTPLIFESCFSLMGTTVIDFIFWSDSPFGYLFVSYWNIKGTLEVSCRFSFWAGASPRTYLYIIRAVSNYLSLWVYPPLHYQTSVL